jgi:hypothetical protein
MTTERPHKRDIRKFAALTGLVLMGPLLLAYTINAIIVGELPLRYGHIATATDRPVTYYLALAAHMVAALGMTWFGILLLIGHIKGRRN